MKKLMILGTGYFQEFVIRKAMNMGLYIIGVDGNPDASGKDLCDIFELCDIKDSDGCLKIAKKYKIDGVLLVGCDAIETVAKIEEWLGILGWKQKLIASDKHLSKEKLREWGGYVPICYSIGKKFVIKPVRGWGSRDIKKMEYKEDMCIEEYIEGQEITIDGLIVNNDVQVLGISDKEKPIFGIAQHIHYPTNLDDKYISRATTVALQLLHINNCAFHIEGIMRDGKLYFIDIACRTTGGISTHIIPHISGTDFIGNIIKLAIREKVTDYKPKCKKAASFCFIIPPEGFVEWVKVDSKKIIELVEKDILMHWKFNIQPGDVIKNPDIDSTRLGHYIINAKNRKQIDKYCKLMMKYIQVGVK